MWDRHRLHAARYLGMTTHVGSDSQFLERVDQQALNRAPDPSGLAPSDGAASLDATIISVMIALLACKQSKHGTRRGSACSCIASPVQRRRLQPAEPANSPLQPSLKEKCVPSYPAFSPLSRR